MITKELYVDQNVPHTIYNQISKSFFKGTNFYQNLFDSCYKSNHGGCVSCEEYHQACLDYANKMIQDDKFIMKFIKKESEIFVKPTWREELRDFNCKSNKEFMAIVKSIIAN